MSSRCHTRVCLFIFDLAVFFCLVVRLLCCSQSSLLCSRNRQRAFPLTWPRIGPPYLMAVCGTALWRSSTARRNEQRGFSRSDPKQNKWLGALTLTSSVMVTWLRREQCTLCASRSPENRKNSTMVHMWVHVWWPLCSESLFTHHRRHTLLLVQAPVGRLAGCVAVLGLLAA